MTRDELRKIYTFLKKETGVKGAPSRSLGSKEECLESIREVLSINESTIVTQSRLINALREENKILREELKADKKWWQIWKER